MKLLAILGVGVGIGFYGPEMLMLGVAIWAAGKAEAE